jgi:hypothetical protein
VLKGQTLPAESGDAAGNGHRGQRAGAETTPRSSGAPAPAGPGLDQPVKPGAALALRKEPAPGPRSSTPQEQLEEFAKDLRELRAQAGLGYPEMAELSHYTMKTLASAAGGLNLPTLPVVMAYVRACDGSVPAWEDRWHKLADLLKPAADGAAGNQPAAPSGSPGDGPDPDGAGEPADSRGSDARDGEAREETVRRERPGRAGPRPSQVSSPRSARPGDPAPEQEPLPPPPRPDQVYVITSAAPRRPYR